ncbi:hypothetical protein L208DRAFT_1412239, partial [Tricholoma matsutake]
TTATNNDKPPTSSLTSNCSWGGTWVERCPGATTMTHHPPPASQATAHGVDHGW